MIIISILKSCSQSFL